MATVLDRLGAVIDELVAADPQALGNADDVRELQRQLNRLEAVNTVAIAAFDASGAWMPSRCRSAGDWLAWQCHMSRNVAKRRVRLGRCLRKMPATERAWLDGELTLQHVTQLAKAYRPAAAEDFARDEKMLLDDAKELTYASFVRVVEYWIQHADPDGAEDDAEAKRARRRFDLSPSFDGMYLGSTVLDPVTGAIVCNELKRLEQKLFDDDWAEAKVRLGREPCIFDLRRTPGNRRADALKEMAIRSRTAPADGRRPEPLFTVLVDYETFAGPICELANGTVVTPGSLVPWLEQAWIERVVFDSPSRVIDVGVRQRLFTGATRRAIEVRDRECFHPSCEEPAEDGQIDHVQPYGWGGLTIEANGRAACGFHNRARHRRSGPPTP